MKVLLVHNFYRTAAPSGEDIVVENERRMLSKHCEVVSYFKHNDDLDDSSIINRLAMAADAVWSISGFREVRKLIDSCKPDIVHVHNTFPQISPSVYWAAKCSDIPVVQTLHNYRMHCANGLLLRDGRPCDLCEGAVPYSAIRYKCYRNSLAATSAVVTMQITNRMAGSYRNNVDTFIALTQFAKNKLQAVGLKGSRFRIKPNFLPSPPHVGSYPREPHAVFVGRLTEEKGIWSLVRAWPRGMHHRLVVVGDGALRRDLENYSTENRLNIVFRGHCDRESVMSAVQSATLQIVPSLWYEGFPMVVLEAYACGTAVLASELGGLAESVVDGVTGRLFPAGDVDALRSRIIEMLEGNETESMGRAGRRLFDEHYTEESNVKQLLSIYEEALESRSKRGAVI